MDGTTGIEENVMITIRFYVLALKILAVLAVLYASLLSLFSNAVDKWERAACLYLSAVAYAAIAMTME